MTPFSSDSRLLRLSGSDDYFTVRDFHQNVLALGQSGSGKTSGSGKHLAMPLLRAGMGGLVLCAKPEEAESWRRYCEEAGRLNSLVIWRGEAPGFNPIAYELVRQGPGGINGVAELVMAIIEMCENASPMPGKASDAFWGQTTRQVLRNSLPIIYAATGGLAFADIRRFASSAPQSAEQMQDPQWQHGSYFYKAFSAAASRLDDATGGRVVSYWRDEFAALDPKTRGNILISLTTALDRFCHGWLEQAFCGDTLLFPELCFHGAIIVLDMPALTRNEDGIVAQQLYKYMWQRAVLARNGLPPEQRERSVFLYADEAQYFLNSHDAEFLSTCRGSRCGTIFLSQSLPTFYAKMSGENARERVHHLLGNFGTRIWHSSACAETNEWAARTLGRVQHYRTSYNETQGSSSNVGMNLGEGSNWGRNWGGSSGSSSSGKGSSSSASSNWGGSEGGSDNWGRNRGTATNQGMSQGYSEQMDHLIEPGAFGRMLKTGGPANGNRVSAVWYQAGRQFKASGTNALLVEYKQ